MLMLMLSRSAISLLRSPCATNRSTSISRCESWFELSAVDEDCRTKLAMRSIMASEQNTVATRHKEGCVGGKAVAVGNDKIARLLGGVFCRCGIGGCVNTEQVTQQMLDAGSQQHVFGYYVYSSSHRYLL